jgi:hypothetical protein
MRFRSHLRSPSMSTPDALTAMLDAQVAVAHADGSRFYARLFELMREDAAADGPTRAALAGHEHDRVDECDMPAHKASSSSTRSPIDCRSHCSYRSGPHARPSVNCR